MDKKDERGFAPDGLAAGYEVDPTEAERMELSCRLIVHRRNPDEAVALDDALLSIERSLGY
jgi:hypothetical protein